MSNHGRLILSVQGPVHIFCLFVHNLGRLLYFVYGSVKCSVTSDLMIYFVYGSAYGKQERLIWSVFRWVKLLVTRTRLIGSVRGSIIRYQGLVLMFCLPDLHRCWTEEYSWCTAFPNNLVQIFQLYYALSSHILITLLIYIILTFTSNVVAIGIYRRDVKYSTIYAEGLTLTWAGCVIGLIGGAGKLNKDPYWTIFWWMTYTDTGRRTGKNRCKEKPLGPSAATNELYSGLKSTTHPSSSL